MIVGLLRLVDSSIADFLQNPMQIGNVKTQTKIHIAVCHMKNMKNVAALPDFMMVGKFADKIIALPPADFFGNHQSLQVVKQSDDADFFVD